MDKAYHISEKILAEKFNRNGYAEFKIGNTECTGIPGLIFRFHYVFIHK